MSKATEVADRIVQAFEHADPKAFAECFAEDAVQHHPFFPEPNVGREGVFRAESGMFESFDQIHFTVERVIDGEPWAAFEFRVTARHSAPLPMPDGNSVPATGKTVDLSMASIMRIDGAGLIAEEHRYMDNLSFLRQLGLA
jgi:ketosteroid isomerase-like protein